MTSKSMLPAISPGGNLSRYLDQIRAFPMLEPGEEYMLAKSWKEKGDVAAAHKLVTSHLRLVAKIAMGYRGYGLPVADLISEGNLGMMHAVVARRDKKIVEHAHSIDMLSVYPELIYKIQRSHADQHIHWRTSQIHGQIKYETNVISASLPKRRTEIVFFALVMSAVRRPHNPPFVAATMFPVVAKIVSDKGDHPVPPSRGLPWHHSDKCHCTGEKDCRKT